MKIYIASSWKNQHAVEMLTALLRERNHEVLSFIENGYNEGYLPNAKMNFEKWVNSSLSNKAFKFDSEGAMGCNLLIYIAPSGKDAAAECGMAYAKGIPIIGLFAKSEDFGLMRKMMVAWYERYFDILEAIAGLEP